MFSVSNDILHWTKTPAVERMILHSLRFKSEESQFWRISQPHDLTASHWMEIIQLAANELDLKQVMNDFPIGVCCEWLSSQNELKAVPSISHTENHSISVQHLFCSKKIWRSSIWFEFAGLREEGRSKYYSQ